MFVQRMRNPPLLVMCVVSIDRPEGVIGSDRVQWIKDCAKNYDSLDDDKAKDTVRQCPAVRQYPSDSVADACA